MPFLKIPNNAANWPIGSYKTTRTQEMPEGNCKTQEPPKCDQKLASRTLRDMLTCEQSCSPYPTHTNMRFRQDPRQNQEHESGNKLIMEPVNISLPNVLLIQDTWYTLAWCVYQSVEWGWSIEFHNWSVYASADVVRKSKSTLLIVRRTFQCHLLLLIESGRNSNNGSHLSSWSMLFAIVALLCRSYASVSDR